MPHGRRCPLGCESWPDSDAYNVCPACGEPTQRYRNLNPLPEEEAHRIKTDLAFEEYYQQHCAQHKITEDGPILALG